MSSTETHPSDVEIARILLGKASEEEARSAAAHAAGCDRCRAELDAARVARRRFDEQVFARTLPEIERRLGPRRRWAFWLGALAVTGAAAAILPFLLRPQPPVEGPGWQVKGPGALKAFGRRGDRVIAVKDGVRLRPGDQLRFAVQAGHSRFVLIASVEGGGRTNLYYPSTAVGAGAGQDQILPDSIVLDDAPGPERIFAVFSDRPLENREVEMLLKPIASGRPRPARPGAGGADL